MLAPRFEVATVAPRGSVAVALPRDLSSNVVKLAEVRRLRRHARILTTTGFVIALVVISILVVCIVAEVIR